MGKEKNQIRNELLRVLITCPPMLNTIDEYTQRFDRVGITLTCPLVTQTLSVQELLKLVPFHDGWIIGDDPANHKVFHAGSKGRLKAAVKWGVGIDNVDFAAAKDLQIAIANTPGMFGEEVADVATCYVIGLARDLFWVDRQVRIGNWVKPCGVSLKNKIVGVVGFGDIGMNTARRLSILGMNVIVYDPAVGNKKIDFSTAKWPDGIEKVDFLVFTCALTLNNRHMLNSRVLERAKKGLRIVNVARGPLIDETALVDALNNGMVNSVALDVFEIEPLPSQSVLRKHDHCIFGSHNSSNTREAVRRTNEKVIEQIFKFLKIDEHRKLRE